MPPEARSTFLPPEQFGLKNYEQVIRSISIILRTYAR